MKCKVCGGSANSFSNAIIRGKHSIEYFACPSCHFVQTEHPFWLEEAYAEAINATDVGYVSRNLALSEITHALITVAFDVNARFVDYGGGYGLFVRLMRDQGINFQHSDKYCRNLFAKHFEADETGVKQYELLTAFEVFEHVVEPVQEVEHLLSFTDNIFFSTELLPVPCPAPADWWYYGLNHGQHVSLYSLESLKVIARKFNLNLHSNGRLHLMTKKKVSALALLATKKTVARIINSFSGGKNLLEADTKRLLESKQGSISR